MASAGKMSADDLKNIASLHKFHAVEVEANGSGIKIDDTVKTLDTTGSTSIDMLSFNNKRPDSNEKGNMEKQIELLHKFHEIEVRANTQ